MAWEISERKSLEQIEIYNIKIKAKHKKQRFAEEVLSEKIRVENQRHNKLIAELENKAYFKKEAGFKIPQEIQISSKYPAIQELFDKVEAWASVIQFEPKFDSQHVYLINGKWYDIHESFGPFRDDKGEIIDKNDIDWKNPIIKKIEYEVKKKK